MTSMNDSHTYISTGTAYKRNGYYGAKFNKKCEYGSIINAGSNYKIR